MPPLPLMNDNGNIGGSIKERKIQNVMVIWQRLRCNSGNVLSNIS